MDERVRSFLEAVETAVRPTTRPVGVKLAAPGETPPPKARRPLQDLKRRLTVCQGMTAARTLGWTMVFAAEDHGCPLPKVFMGYVDAERFLDGTVAGYYQSDPECGRAMEAAYPRWPAGRYPGIWLAPLDRCPFRPDLAVVYGNPAQILTLIQGANYGKGTGIRSVSSGRLGCATWLAGVVQSGESTYLVPGPGERVFAGTQDHEMSFAVPYAELERVAEGLEYVRSAGAFRYPVPNLAALNEPRMPEKYYELEEPPPGEASSAPSEDLQRDE
ncbi:DUF169 domain-containing protein [Deferrisoma camini]|uniref:DUF169 domain-containing protein n=1 Tax=Deferrisoma camini TaxID=1035120 RepID=UPI00046D7613|nr:DUF169 domain-containing protein [Deferrisoma camini]